MILESLAIRAFLSLYLGRVFVPRGHFLRLQYGEVRDRKRSLQCKNKVLALISVFSLCLKYYVSNAEKRCRLNSYLRSEGDPLFIEQYNEER